MKGYKYQSYDYSFLRNEKERTWKQYFNTAVNVAVKTIGFDLTDVKPMSEPRGQLYWMDYTTTNTNSINSNYSTVNIYNPNYTTFNYTVSTGPSIPITISNYNDFTTVYTR